MKKLALLFCSLLCLVSVFAQNPNWSNIGPGGGSDLHFLAIQPDNKDVIYACGDIEGIFKTTNGGQTWKNINNNLAHLPYGADIYSINEIRIDPVDYQKIYICTAVALFKSTNGGNSWQMIYPDTIIDEDTSPPIGTSAIGIDSVNTSRLFLGLGDETSDCSLADFTPFDGYEGPWGVYKSLDGGQTWSVSSTGLPDSLSIHTIDVIPNTDKVIMATNKGVFRSDNGGTSWTAKNSGLPHTNCHRLKVTNDFGDYVATLTMRTIGDVSDSNTFSGGIFRSSDLGNTWDDITANLPKYDRYDNLFYDYWKFDVYQGDADIIYVATQRGSGYDETGIFVTWDGGIEWELAYTPEIGGWMDQNWFWEGYAHDILIAPSDPTRVVIALDDIEISNDAGYTWSQAFTTKVGSGWKGNGLELMNTESVAFHPTDSQKIYVGYDDNGLFRSDDGANSFIRLDPVQDPEIGNLVDIDAVKDVYIDPANGDLYIERYQGTQNGYTNGYSSGGITFSSDDGVTQSDITGSMPLARHDIAVDFTTGSAGNRTLYSAVFHEGVYKSTNSGTSWTAINTGLGSDAPYVWDIAIDPGNSQELYVAINSWGQGNNGLYKSTDGGQNWTKITGVIAGDVSKVYISNTGDIYAGISDDFEWNYTGGLYRSTDDGTTWTKILDHSRVVDVQVSPFHSHYILAVGQQWYNVSLAPHGVYLSRDYGLTWSIISENTSHGYFNFARFSPHDRTQVYAGSAGGGLWKTHIAFSIGVPDAKLYGENDINIYPSPSSNKVYVELSEITKEINIIVSNIHGQQVLKLNFENKKIFELDIDQLRSGVYFVQIYSESKTYVRKLIKQ